MLPLCYRCNHKVTSHAVDDEARAECMECSCPAWENSPDGKPIYPAPMDVIDAAAERYDPGHLLRVNVDLRRSLAEHRVVLGALLNLFDPPGEAKRRHHAEDENGFWMAVSGSVQIGRQLIPKPPACRMCRGGGADEYGAECSDCDGEGYDAKAPITDAERRVWDAIRRNVAERAKEE